MFVPPLVWFLLTTLFAFIFRKKNTVEFLLLYTCVLVAVNGPLGSTFIHRERIWRGLFARQRPASDRLVRAVIH
jgi:hypothetical protein